MATVQIILAGQVGTSRVDTYDYPLVLQFGQARNYGQAEWVIPSYGPHIPAWRLSEIRVESGGEVGVLIDGPDGFRSGPHPTNWVRSQYPRGKDCALLKIGEDPGKLTGLTITTIDDELFLDEYSLGQ